MARRPATRKERHQRAATKSTSQLRIISGEWRGRKLPVADLPGLRPTSDRVRETLFNWIQPYVPGAKVLDCFSGTGALAFEALSRGAHSAILLEAAAPAIERLRANIKALDAQHAHVIHTDTLNWLQTSHNEQSLDDTQPFDLIFLDPPFRKNFLEDTCRYLTKQGYVDDNTLIYIEVEKELQPLPVPLQWHQLKAKQAGQLNFYLYQGCA